MLNEQWNQILPAIIGVVGTLLGTILGWILSNLSKRGKLRIFSTWKDEFQCLDRKIKGQTPLGRNGGKPKLDIREWSPDHTHMSRGITLTDAQCLKLARLIAERARDNQRQSPVRDNFER